MSKTKKKNAKNSDSKLMRTVVYQGPLSSIDWELTDAATGKAIEPCITGFKIEVSTNTLLDVYVDVLPQRNVPLPQSIRLRAQHQNCTIDITIEKVKHEKIATYVYKNSGKTITGSKL